MGRCRGTHLLRLCATTSGGAHGTHLDCASGRGVLLVSPARCDASTPRFAFHALAIDHPFAGAAHCVIDLHPHATTATADSGTLGGGRGIRSDLGRVTAIAPVSLCPSPLAGEDLLSLNP